MTPGEFTGLQRLFARALLFLDAPDHPRVRKVLATGFRADALARLRPRIERIADELLDGQEGAETFDFIQAVARPLPVRVISRILGIDGADSAELMAWSDDLAAFIGAPLPTPDLARRARASVLAMTRYFEKLLPQKRRTPGEKIW